MDLKNLSVRADLVMRFGDRSDGVIGIPCLTRDNQLIEASYFYGREKMKNIIVISSQAGCPMRCLFCELGSERFARNLTPTEMSDQVKLLLNEAGKEGFSLKDKPHKITIANSGEPLLNPNISAAIWGMMPLCTSFKISTVLPAGSSVFERLAGISHMASSADNPIQLQISLISTSETERQKIAGAVAGFRDIRRVGQMWREANPDGRKVNLSLIITSAMDCDPKKIVAFFPPELFRFRFREYVPTENGRGNGLTVVSPEKLAEVKKRFAESGYEITHFASPTATERRFGLASNRIRKIYMDMVGR